MTEHPERVAWLPYPNLAAAEAAIGPLPAGVRFEPCTGPDQMPDTLDEVEFLVMPYLDGRPVVERAAQMPRLQVVQLQSAGYEDVLPLIPEGVTLCNAAGLHDASTAELALALALASGRHLDRFARQQSEGRWQPAWGSALADKRVGILGAGNIGRAIEARLAGFEVASVTRIARTARDGVHAITELATLAAEIDVLFVIVPLTEQTTGLVGAEVLAALPDDALVVNVARGKVVDTDALLAETSSGRLRAALDVTDPEPLPADHPLWQVENVLVSPHVGGASSAFWPRRDRLIRDQLARWAGEDDLANIVNGS